MFLSWFTMFLLSSPTHAMLDEPTEPIAFNRAEPIQFSEGLCPGNPLKNGPVTPQPVVPGKQDLQALMALDRKVQAAARAVQAGYNVPNFENVSSGAELITRSSAFIGQVPANYRFFGLFTEPELGLKFLLLKPASADAPLILSVIGTESFEPWLTDYLAGHAPELSNSRIVRMFVTCKYTEEFSLPLASRRLIISGHSIGGGLAQALAYTIQSIRVKSGLSPMNIELITFNAFGGKSLVKDYDPKIGDSILARNYFVEGDIVHEVGEHVGPLYNLGRPSKSAIPHNDAMYTHLISTVTFQGTSHIMMLSAYAYSPMETVAKPRALSELIDMRNIVYALPNRIFEHKKERVVELLSEGVLTLELTKFVEEEDRETARFVSRLTYSRELSLRDGTAVTIDSELVRELKGLRMRLNRAVP